MDPDQRAQLGAHDTGRDDIWAGRAIDSVRSAANLVRVALQELANDGADAATLAHGPSSRAAMQILRHANGDPGRVDAWCVAERRSPRSWRPNGFRRCQIGQGTRHRALAALDI